MRPIVEFLLASCVQSSNIRGCCLAILAPQTPCVCSHAGMFRDAQVLPGQALRGYTAAPPQQAYRPAGLLTWDLIQLRLRDGVGLPIPQHDPNAGFEWLEHAAPDFTFADIPYADKLIQLSGKCALTVQQGSLSCLRPGSCQGLAEARCAGD